MYSRFQRIFFYYIFYCDLYEFCPFGNIGVALICFSLSKSFWLSLALLLPAGFAMMIEMASSNTLIQTMVPDELRGRVMAVY